MTEEASVNGDAHSSCDAGFVSGDDCAL